MHWTSYALPVIGMTIGFCCAFNCCRVWVSKEGCYDDDSQRYMFWVILGLVGVNLGGVSLGGLELGQGRTDVAVVLGSFSCRPANWLGHVVADEAGLQVECR